MNNSELSYTTAPAFLNKLWSLVEDPSTDELICWDPSGESFHVLDQARFARDILPLYFKHRNIASFIRQLNMYGFRKVVNIEITNIKVENDDLEFAHQFFIRNHEHLLDKIKRKISGVNRVNETISSSMSGNNIMKIINEVKTLKVKQETMADKFDTMKLENDVLWREVVNLRQQNIKQQEILNKLIQFLMSLVSKERTSIKRKIPLMITPETKLQPSSSLIIPTDNIDPPPPPKIVRKATFLRPQIKIVLPPKQKRENLLLEPLAVVDPVKIQASAKLTDCLDESDIDSLLQAVDYESQLNPSNLNTPVILNSANPMMSQYSANLHSTITHPPDNSLPTVTSAAHSQNMLQVSKQETYLPEKEDLVQNLEVLQNGIENLRELFSSGQYSIDASTLFELFGSESPSGANSNLMLSSGDNDPYANQNDLQTLSKINALSARGSHLMALNAPPQNVSGIFTKNNISPFMDIPNNDNFLLDETLRGKVQDEKNISTPLEDLNMDDFILDETADIYNDFLNYDSII